MLRARRGGGGRHRSRPARDRRRSHPVTASGRDERPEHATTVLGPALIVWPVGYGRAIRSRRGRGTAPRGALRCSTPGMLVVDPLGDPTGVGGSGAFAGDDGDDLVVVGVDQAIEQAGWPRSARSAATTSIPAGTARGSRPRRSGRRRSTLARTARVTSPATTRRRALGHRAAGWRRRRLRGRTRAGPRTPPGCPASGSPAPAWRPGGRPVRRPG